MTPSTGARMFTCPQCRETYLGGSGERLPDCPRCGHDYRTRRGFRFDLLVMMVLIIAMIGFMVLGLNYKSGMGGASRSQALQGDMPEKLPGR